MPSDSIYLKEVNNIYVLLENKFGKKLDYLSSEQGVIMKVSTGEKNSFHNHEIIVEVLIPFILSIPYKVYSLSPRCLKDVAEEQMNDIRRLLPVRTVQK